MISLLKTNEVAKYLKMSVSNVRHLTATQQIPFIKIGALVRFNVDQIEHWLKCRTRLDATNARSGREKK